MPLTRGRIPRDYEPVRALLFVPFFPALVAPLVFAVPAVLAVQENEAFGAEPVLAQCASAYEDAQLLRQRGKLLAARERAAVCARDQCPDVARHDCARWGEELAREVPSVVVVVRDEADHDVVADHVFVDGALHTEIGTGRSFELDPGAHVFRLERPGVAPIEKSYTLYLGERDRVLRITVPGGLPAPARPAAATATTASSPAKVAVPPPSPPSYVPAAVIAGVSVVAFGVSAYLGWTGRQQLSDLRTSCAPICTDAEVDPVKTRLTLSDVSLGVGIVGAALATYLFVRAATDRPATSTAHAEIVPLQGGVAALVGARF